MRLVVLMMALTLPAQAKKRRPEPPPPEPPIVAPADPGVQAGPGSLWDEVNARQLMGMDGNARQVGDLITVSIAESIDTQVGAATNTRRQSAVQGDLSAMFGAVKKLTKNDEDLSELQIAAALMTEFSGSGETSRGSAVEATLTCEVIEVLSNGNLRIWGYETLRLNRETQYLTLEGIIRPRDVQMDNTVRSDLIARPVLQVTGSGVVADKQGPGWFMRLLDALWPF